MDIHVPYVWYFSLRWAQLQHTHTQKNVGKYRIHVQYFLRETQSQSEYTACMVLAELKHKLKYTECTVFFSRWAQFEVYGVGAFLDRHNLQHMVLVQNRHAD